MCYNLHVIFFFNNLTNYLYFYNKKCVFDFKYIYTFLNGLNARFFFFFFINNYNMLLTTQLDPFPPKPPSTLYMRIC